MEAGGIAGGRKLVPKCPFAEHLGELRQELQMLFGGVFRHEEHEYLCDRLAVRRIERNRLTRSYERAQRVREPPDPAVRDCYTLAKPCRAEFFARKQAVEYDRAGNLCLVLEQLTDLLEEPLLARRFKVKQDVRFGKQLRDLVQE